MSYPETQDEEIGRKAKLFALRGAESVLEYLDQSSEWRDFYSDATRTRTANSFRVSENEEGESILGIDVTEDSSLARFADELLSPTPGQKLAEFAGFESSERPYKAEGFADGIYESISNCDADNILLIADDENYFAPTEGGVGSLEVIRKMAEDGHLENDDWNASKEYIIQEKFDNYELLVWNEWTGGFNLSSESSRHPMDVRA